MTLACAAAAIAPADCSEALGPERLALYARTTWGRQCRDADLHRRLERESPTRARRFRGLCEALAKDRSGGPE
jgi:hypothetical protein